MQRSAPDYMTTREVADYLRLKERTVYDLASRQAIPCSRATGKLLFPRRLVDRWVESNLHYEGRSVASPPPVVAGSSDPLLEWALRESGSGLATLAEGSARGLERLAENAAVAAGLHLPDAEGGGFNLSAVRALGRVHDLVLLEWAVRRQGLVVAKDNPLGLEGVADLAPGSRGRRAPRVVMRQEGAGGQRLLDHLLKAADLDSAGLDRAPRLALTDGDVAGAVLDGEADCGLAVGAVARRFGLGFVPLMDERFDLACRRRDAFEPPLQALFSFTRTPAFAERAALLGFYDVSGAGTVRFNS